MKDTDRKKVKDFLGAIYRAHRIPAPEHLKTRKKILSARHRRAGVWPQCLQGSRVREGQARDPRPGRDSSVGQLLGIQEGGQPGGGMPTLP